MSISFRVNRLVEARKYEGTILDFGILKAVVGFFSPFSPPTASSLETRGSSNGSGVMNLYVSLSSSSSRTGIVASGRMWSGNMLKRTPGLYCSSNAGSRLLSSSLSFAGFFDAAFGRLGPLAGALSVRLAFAGVLLRTKLLHKLRAPGGCEVDAGVSKLLSCNNWLHENSCTRWRNR